MATFERNWDVPSPLYVEVHDALTRGLGGWTLSGHHALHPSSGTLYRGDAGMLKPAQTFEVKPVFTNPQLGGMNTALDLTEMAVTREGGVFLFRRYAGASFRFKPVYKAPGSGNSQPVPIELSATVDPASTASSWGSILSMSLDPRTERLLVAAYSRNTVYEVSPPSEWVNGVPSVRSIYEANCQLDSPCRRPVGVVVRDNGSVVIAVENDQPAGQHNFLAFELLEQGGLPEVPPRLAPEPLFGWEGSVSPSRPVFMKAVPGSGDAVVVASAFAQTTGNAISKLFLWTPGEGVRTILWKDPDPDEVNVPDRYNLMPPMNAREVQLVDNSFQGLLPLEDGKILFSLDATVGSYNPNHQIFALVPEEDSEAGVKYTLERWAGRADAAGCNPGVTSTAGSANVACFGRYGAGLALGPDGHVWINGAL